METHYQLYHNENSKRYEFHIDNLRPYVQYKIKGDIIYLTFAKVPSELEGQGIGKALVEAVLEEIERRGFKVIPQCRFIAAIMQRKSRWRKLLA